MKCTCAYNERLGSIKVDLSRGGDLVFEEFRAEEQQDGKEVKKKTEYKGDGDEIKDMKQDDNADALVVPWHLLQYAQTHLHHEKSTSREEEDVHAKSMEEQLVVSRKKAAFGAVMIVILFVVALALAFTVF